MNEELFDRMEQLAGRFERMNFEEYIRYATDRRRFWRMNFWAGVARGVGTAVGFTILGAVVIVAFQHIMTMNIPVIGGFLAEVVKVVRERL